MEEEEVTGQARGIRRAVDEVNFAPAHQESWGGVNTHIHMNTCTSPITTTDTSVYP